MCLVTLTMLRQISLNQGSLVLYIMLHATLAFCGQNLQKMFFITKCVNYFCKDPVSKSMLPDETLRAVLSCIHSCSIKQQTGSRFSLPSGHVTKVLSFCDEGKSNNGTFMMPFILEHSTNSSILVKNLY